MPDTPATEGGFDFISGRSERTILSNVDRVFASLLPETVSSNPAVRWLRGLQERDNPDARNRDFYDKDSFRYFSGGRALIVRSMLEPVVQARLDFLTQSLYPVARMIRVSDRAIEVITASREPEHIATTRAMLHDDQHTDVVELRDAVSESLADLLTATEEVHRERRTAALQAFEEWLTETNTFRSVFEPANKALGDALDSRRRGRDRPDRWRDSSFFRFLAPLVAYLSRYPQLGSVLRPDDRLAMRRENLVLSPGEMAGLLMALQSSPDMEGESFWRYEQTLHEFTRAFGELSEEPLVQADLARLQQRIANFNPFSEQLVGPPSESLRAAMRDHVLPNGKWSPWLRQFLGRFDEEPRWWREPVRPGSAQDLAYIEALAHSAHGTIVHHLIDEAPHLGEPWDEFLERLFREKWLRPLRKAIARSGDPLWTHDRFIAVVAALRERLVRDGYRLSIDDQELGNIWNSVLNE